MKSGESKIRAVIVDDEPLARQTLRVLLGRDPDLEVVAECSDGFAAIEAVERLAPELLFLDIQMPELDGFEVLRALDPARLPAIVFVTAYDRFAVRAFEVRALDYLLKPFDDARFAQTLSRAKEQVKQRAVKDLSQRLIALLEHHQPAPTTEKTATQADARGYMARLMIKSGGRITFLKTAEIDWIEAADYYVQLHAGPKAHLLRQTMNELETRLDPEQFLRIHRSTIVNLERVKELQAGTGGEYALILHDGTVLKLSRSRRAQIEAALNRQR